MQAVLHRVELELAVELDDDLSVEGGVGRKEITELAQFREVAKQRPLVATPERELAAIVLEYSAESIPLGLVLPARALRELLDEERLHRREGHGPNPSMIHESFAAQPSRIGATSSSGARRQPGSHCTSSTSWT